MNFNMLWITIAICFASYLSAAEQIFLAPGQSKTIQDKEVIALKEVKKTSLSKRCIADKLNGECSEYEKTFSYAGTSCTEDCLVLSKLDLCALKNKCIFDQESGCFTKKTCVDVSPVNGCREWQETNFCS